MGADYRGDPASAMLEVLDPEQNSHVPRPLPRRAVRPLERHVHHHGEHARHDPRAAARPHGDHPARRLHRGGEARDRQALPRAAPDRAQRPEEVVDRVHRRGAADDHRRLHARGGRAQPRARDRHGLPQGRAPGRRGQRQAAAKLTISDRRVRELLGRPRVHLGDQAPHAGAGRGHRAGLDAGRRRRAVRRGHGDAGRGQAHHHRPARRRDERVGAGGALLRARPSARAGARRRRRLVRRARHPHPRPGRARSRRTARAPASRWPPRSCRCSPGARCATTSR